METSDVIKPWISMNYWTRPRVASLWNIHILDICTQHECRYILANLGLRFLSFLGVNIFWKDRACIKCHHGCHVSNPSSRKKSSVLRYIYLSRNNLSDSVATMNCIVRFFVTVESTLFLKSWRLLPASDFCEFNCWILGLNKCHG